MQCRPVNTIQSTANQADKPDTINATKLCNNETGGHRQGQRWLEWELNVLRKYLLSHPDDCTRKHNSMKIIEELQCGRNRHAINVHIAKLKKQDNDNSHELKQEEEEVT